MPARKGVQGDFVPGLFDGGFSTMRPSGMRACMIRIENRHVHLRHDGEGFSRFNRSFRLGVNCNLVDSSLGLERGGVNVGFPASIQAAYQALAIR